MRTSNSGKGRRVTDFFRLCVCILILVTLAMGGMMLKTEPVQAFDLAAPPPPNNFDVIECQSSTITFTNDGNYTCVMGTVHYDYIFLWGMFPGLNATWDMNTGVLTVCPDPGTVGNVYNFTVMAVSMDDTACVEPLIPHACTITVQPPGPPTPPLTITPVWYPVAWEGQFFTMTLAATGCSGTYSWAATGLPVGLTLDPSTGVISGIPAPGTCGSHIVNVTCTDTVMCPSAGCCPPASAPFTLIIDCWANYIALMVTYSATACDFTVEIGPGLTQGQTRVLIDGSQEAILAGGGSETFTSVPCESHLVVVDQVVQGPDPQTRFTVIGSNQKTVTDIDNHAYFDYAREVHIGTSSDPSGLTQPPGAGFYAVGNYFSSTAPSTIDSDIQNGIKYVFREWKLPDGSTLPTRDLAFAANQGGTATAAYDTYYLLTLKSDYPPIEERSWELKDSTATYDLALKEVPMESGFWAFLGGTISPVNSRGTQNMSGPSTVEILWKPNYMVPIIAIVVTLLVIAGVVFFVLRRKGAGVSAVPATTVAQVPQPPAVDTEAAKITPAVTATVEKKALTEAESTDEPNFCPKCGVPVEKDAVFCKKCGKKLVKDDK